MFKLSEPLLGVNLSPEFVNLYFPYAGWGLLFFSLVPAAFWIPIGTCGSGRKKQCCAKYIYIYMNNLKSHFWWDFLAYCTRPASVNLVMAFTGCSFNSFSIFFAQFKTTTKFHENYVFLYPFSSMAISPQNNEKHVFYTGKLYGLTGMS